MRLFAHALVCATVCAACGAPEVGQSPAPVAPTPDPNQPLTTGTVTEAWAALYTGVIPLTAGDPNSCLHTQLTQLPVGPGGPVAVTTSGSATDLTTGELVPWTDTVTPGQGTPAQIPATDVRTDKFGTCTWAGTLTPQAR